MSQNAIDDLTFKPYEAEADEEYMSDAQLAHFENMLKAWKQQLTEEAESTKTYIQDESAAL